MQAACLPVVSVIMPVYNGERYLAEAIESILGQTFTDFEFIIVDDGSQDSSAAIIQSYAERDSRIQSLRNERNTGISRTMNRGMAIATGEYIAVMEHDDISLPHRLDRQVAFLQANARIGLLGGGILLFEGESLRLHGATKHKQHAFIALAILVGYAMAHPTVMMRTSLVKAVGGYDPEFDVAQDVELYVRLLMDQRARFANIPEVLVKYRTHDTRASVTEKPRQRRAALIARLRLLEWLGHSQPEAALRRLRALRPGSPLSWRQRREVKREWTWLIESLIARNVVDAEDKTMLLADVNRRVESASPRRWQMFIHWRRHRLGF